MLSPLNYDPDLEMVESCDSSPGWLKKTKTKQEQILSYKCCKMVFTKWSKTLQFHQLSLTIMNMTPQWAVLAISGSILHELQTIITTEAASRSFLREPGLHIQLVIPHNPKKIRMTFYHILIITFFLPEQPDSFSPSHFLVFSSFKLKHYRETS